MDESHLPDDNITDWLGEIRVLGEREGGGSEEVKGRKWKSYRV